MTTAGATEPRLVRTNIPARMDRLPWSRFHWRIIFGLGTVWILDGLEVTMVGAVAPRLTEHGSGVSMTSADIGTAAAIYVAGACIGALLFGRLTDKYGRKKLFMATMALYIAATVATAFAFSPLYFFIARFFTGMGIGGEYSAINSAIDELIPARSRGQVDLAINGSYWVGSAIGSVAALVLLDRSLFAADLGWRLAFGIGAVLGLGIVLVRRHVPESPRWLFIHGREDEAERIVDEIEREVTDELGISLPEVRDEIVVRQRGEIPFRQIARVGFTRYRNRAFLGLALIIGQAFLYNAVTFDLGTILNGFFDVSSARVPYYMVIFALGNFLGPLLLGRLFDTVGRKPMVAGTYFAASILTAVLAILLRSGDLTSASFIALVGVTFFFASAGASSAYLTVSEVFPLETRALAIAFFFALGTAIGGVTGPALFGQFIHSGNADQVATGFFIGAAVMALGGLAEVLWGVRAEQRSLEEVARPLTAEEADGRPPEPPVRTPDEEQRDRDRDDRIRARNERRGERERHGMRRVRPGPGTSFYSPAMQGTAGTPSYYTAMADRELDREIEDIAAIVNDRAGPTARAEVARSAAARSWGPGRFGKALRSALDEGRVRRVGRDTYAPGSRG
jgi:MFS family permease